MTDPAPARDLLDDLLNDFQAMGYGHRPVVERRIVAIVDAARADEATALRAEVQRAEANQRRAFEWLSGDVCVYLAGGGTCYRGPDDDCHKNVGDRPTMSRHRYVTALDMDAASIVRRARAALAAPEPAAAPTLHREDGAGCLCPSCLSEP